MNWIKTEDKLPNFGEVVLLLEQTENTNICQTGKLQSVDINGNNWNTGNLDNTFLSVFGGRAERKSFYPNYWCEIVLPNDGISA